MKKIVLISGIFLILSIGLLFCKTEAAQQEISIISTDGSDCHDILDDDYWSVEDFLAGTTLTIQTTEPIDSIYIKWDRPPGRWTLKDGEQEIVCGENDFRHEYVKLSGTSNTATLVAPEGGFVIADLFAFSAGELPDFVQQWQPSWDKADILVVSAHADDEEIFFGGLIPNYTNEDRARVQLAYFCDFTPTEPWRTHEILDGLWTMGVDHYPQLGLFPDEYSESIEEALTMYDYDEGLAYITETIRHFQPKVVVSHDVNGEYGHGCHMLVSKLVQDAVQITADASKNPESAQKYGTWDVPKTYLHLYPEGAIELNARVPLADFGGKTAIEVARAAYDRHISQHWTDFVVEDGYDDHGNRIDYKYGNVFFGLYRSTVGADFSMNDVLDNITTYDQEVPEPVVEPETEAAVVEKPEKKAPTLLIVIIVVLLVIIIALAILYLVAKAHQRKKQRERERERRRRIQRQRQRMQQRNSQRNDQRRR